MGNSRKTQFFSGNQSEIDQFVPKKLSRRQVTSKYSSIFDLTGKMGPILAEAKDLLRDTIEATTDWDTPMPDNLRNRWLEQFMLWEKLRGLQFERAVMPSDAVDEKMRIIVLGDFAKKLLVVGSWGGFKRKSGSWSCSHILSRYLLSDRNQTIPKGELQSLTNASNMAWLLRKLLSEWVDSYIICGDSVIALCWVSAEKKSLSIFHRNRVIQIRRGSELSSLYHVATDQNLADLGTRPDKVKLSDIGPNSEWENGRSWMHMDVSQAVEEGVLKPISELRGVDEKDAEDYKDGLVIGSDLPDIICHKVSSDRVDLLEQRTKFSNYLLVPTKFSFRKVVHILAIVHSFIDRCRKKPNNSQPTDAEIKFSVFHTQIVDNLSVPSKQLSLLFYFREKECETDKNFVLTQSSKSCYR